VLAAGLFVFRLSPRGRRGYQGGVEFHCPDCGLPIATADLAPAQGLAVCRFCEKPFPLAASQAAVPYEKRPLQPVEAPPEGVSLIETMDGFRLTISTRSCVGFFLVPFTLVWSGGSLGGIYGSQIVRGEFDLVMSLFGLPFLAGSVFLFFLSFMATFGRFVVDSAPDGSLRIRKGGLGLYSTRTAAWTDVVSAELEEETSRKKGGYATGYACVLRLRQGEPLKIDVGADRRQALWLARFLARRIRRGR